MKKRKKENWKKKAISKEKESPDTNLPGFCCQSKMLPLPKFFFQNFRRFHNVGKHSEKRKFTNLRGFLVSLFFLFFQNFQRCHNFGKHFEKGKIANLRGFRFCSFLKVEQFPVLLLIASGSLQPRKINCCSHIGIRKLKRKKRINKK